MGAPYGRLVILHITIIFGALAISMTGAPAAAVAILVGLKIVMDLGFHLAEHRPKAGRRHPVLTGAAPGGGSAGLSRPVFEGSSRTVWVWVARQAARRLPEVGVAEGQDLRGQQPGVEAVADGHRGDRDAPGHLDDGQQRVHPAQVLGRDGHADDRQEGLGGEHAGQVRGPAGTGHDDPDALGPRPPRHSGTGHRVCDGR